MQGFAGYDEEGSSVMTSTWPPCTDSFALTAHHPLVSPYPAPSLPPSPPIRLRTPAPALPSATAPPATPIELVIPRRCSPLLQWPLYEGAEETAEADADLFFPPPLHYHPSLQRPWRDVLHLPDSFRSLLLRQPVLRTVPQLTSSFTSPTATCTSPAVPAHFVRRTRDALDAISRGDMSGLLGVMSDDMVFVAFTSLSSLVGFHRLAAPFIGRAGYLEAFTLILQLFTFLHFNAAVTPVPHHQPHHAKVMITGDCSATLHHNQRTIRWSWVRFWLWDERTELVVRQEYYEMDQELADAFEEGPTSLPPPLSMGLPQPLEHPLPDPDEPSPTPLLPTVAPLVVPAWPVKAELTSHAAISLPLLSSLAVVDPHSALPSPPWDSSWTEDRAAHIDSSHQSPPVWEMNSEHSRLSSSSSSPSSSLGLLSSPPFSSSRSSSSSSTTLLPTFSTSVPAPVQTLHPPPLPSSTPSSLDPPITAVSTCKLYILLPGCQRSVVTGASKWGHRGARSICQQCQSICTFPGDASGPTIFRPFTVSRHRSVYVVMRLQAETAALRSGVEEQRNGVDGPEQAATSASKEGNAHARVKRRLKASAASANDGEDGHVEVPRSSAGRPTSTQQRRTEREVQREFKIDTQGRLMNRNRSLTVAAALTHPTSASAAASSSSASPSATPTSSPAMGQASGTVTLTAKRLTVHVSDACELYVYVFVSAEEAEAARRHWRAAASTFRHVRLSCHRLHHDLTIKYQHTGEEIKVDPPQLQQLLVQDQLLLGD